MWQWSDNTTALYYNISWSSRVSAPYCAAFDTSERQLKVIKCDTFLKAEYLCEVPTHTVQQSQPQQQLPVPAKPASTIAGMIECPNQEATRHFLGCDTSSGGRNSPDTPPCPQDRRDLDSLWFQCRDNSGCVPYTLVCDHRQDCADGSDEDFCVFQPCDWSQFACHNKKQVRIVSGVKAL